MPQKQPKEKIEEMEHIEAQEHFTDCPKCQKLFAQEKQKWVKELEKLYKETGGDMDYVFQELQQRIKKVGQRLT